MVGKQEYEVSIMEQQQLENQEAGDTQAKGILERLFYGGTSFVLFYLSGKFAPTAEQIRTLSFSEQYPDWELAAVTFFAAFLIGYLALEPPYRKKK
jgi:hypothetical protein